MTIAPGIETGEPAPGVSTPGAAKTPPGEAALAEAISLEGTPYNQQNPQNPATGLDCSGLLQWSYLHGPNPGIDISRTTDTQWSTSAMNTVYDVYSSAEAQGFSQNDLETGDCIYYFAPGNSGNQAHCMMYAGGGQCIESPQTGQVVRQTNLIQSNGMLTDLSSALPLRGVRRVPGGGLNNAGAPPVSNTDTSSGTGSGNNPTGSDWSDTANSIAPVLLQMKDPPDNLPFSAFFQGQIVPSFSAGSLQVPAFGGAPTLYPTAKLVRGGMGEMVINKFKCYFMMNPEQISVVAGINTDMLSPFQQTSDFWKSGGYWVTNQTISFTLYFNRMYEVWMGDIHGPNGGPGPSDEGCRWDIRALERLMGIFDATANGGGSTGLGNNGWGEWPASQLPLQVVFGSKNALRFQGVINSLDYTFTIFDANMVPVEAYADVEVMRVYLPTMSGADLVSSLVGQTGQSGSATNPNGVSFLGSSSEPFTAR